MKKKVILACSGLGYIKRGLETFTEALFYKLKDEDSFDAFLIKGGGKRRSAKELVITHLPRHTRVAKILAKLINRHPFYIQNITFTIGMLPFLLRQKPAVIYTGEPVVYKFLRRWRKWSGLHFRVIFFTGGQTFPQPFDTCDLLHHVTPALIERAHHAGISSANQFLIPHFTPDTPVTSLTRLQLRKKLSLPPDSIIILSVGAIDNTVKRMNYVIEEVSTLPSNYFLLILGERESETAAVIKYAQKLLPGKNYRIDTVDPAAISEYYQSADIFVLASTNEGFGLVFLEALAAGLPVLTHDHSVAHFVLKEQGCFRDLTHSGVLKNMILTISDNSPDTSDKRKEFVSEHYSWEILVPSYKAMFMQAIQ